MQENKKPTWRDKIKALQALGKRLDLSNDGCSSAPDLNFRECCNEHDFYYRNPVAGITRAQADKKLRKCIRKRWKLPFMPWIYWGAVRAFGWRPWNKARKE